jgi:hypothetical protein
MTCDNVTEKRMGCLMCDRQGVMVSTKTYEPVLCVNEQGQLSVEAFNRHHGSFYDILRAHSVWSTEVDVRTDYVKPDADPDVKVSDRDAKQKSSAKKRKKTSARPFKVVAEHESVYDIIEESLRAIHWDRQLAWPQVSVKSIRVGVSTAHVYVQGLGSTHCLYANKCHGSNRVWFTLNKKGELTLHCHSTKPAYGCKTKPRVKFQVPLRVANKVFNTPNPPDPSNSTKSKRPMNVATFAMRNVTAPNVNARRNPNTAFQCQLDRLQAVYKLNISEPS